MLEPNYPGLSIRQQCVLLEINRSSVYYTPRVVVSDEALALQRVVDEVYTQYPFFGTRQMASYLRTQGHAVEREEIRGIYERLGLRSLAPGPHTQANPIQNTRFTLICCAERRLLGRIMCGAPT